MTATQINATTIAAQINADGGSYYGDKARGWDADGFGRVYFGRDFVTIEFAADGSIASIHADRKGKARAQTIGRQAVELVEQAAAKLV